MRACRELGIARSPSTRRPTAPRCTCGSPTRPTPIGARALARELPAHRQDPRRRARERRRRDPPRLRLPGRERRTSRAPARTAGIVFIGPRAGDDRAHGREDLGPPRGDGGRRAGRAGHARAARPSRGARARGRAHRLPGDAQGRGAAAAARACASSPSAGRARAAPSRARAREAAGAFGDDRVYLEKAILDGRATSRSRCSPTRHGNVVHLCERECSIQRRHQKVIEESPSPLVDARAARADGRARGRARAARRLRERGHGRVPGRTRTGEFYFLEMNTRLQVEHPVTEMVTGIDLVQAADPRSPQGEPLPLRQDGRSRSAATRSSAASTPRTPTRGFLPRPGRIVALRAPGGPGVRDDSGVYEGYEVPIHYDPLLSKLVAWGETRRGRDRADAPRARRVPRARHPHHAAVLRTRAAAPRVRRAASSTPASWHGARRADAAAASRRSRSRSRRRPSTPCARAGRRPRPRWPRRPGARPPGAPPAAREAHGAGSGADTCSSTRSVDGRTLRVEVRARGGAVRACTLDGRALAVDAVVLDGTPWRACSSTARATTSRVEPRGGGLPRPLPRRERRWSRSREAARGGARAPARRASGPRASRRPDARARRARARRRGRRRRARARASWWSRR